MYKILKHIYGDFYYYVALKPNTECLNFHNLYHIAQARQYINIVYGTFLVDLKPST